MFFGTGILIHSQLTGEASMKLTQNRQKKGMFEDGVPGKE